MSVFDKVKNVVIINLKINYFSDTFLLRVWRTFPQCQSSDNTTNIKEGNDMQILLILNLIVPFVMILVGTLLKRNPQWDMKKQNGYNTPTSRKSQAHWDYAQQIAPDIYISLGKYLTVVEVIISVILLLLRISVEYSIVIGSCIGGAFLLYGFYHTDQKISEKFADK